LVVQLRGGKVFQVFKDGKLIWQNPEFEEKPSGFQATSWEELPGSASLGETSGRTVTSWEELPDIARRVHEKKFRSPAKKKNAVTEGEVLEFLQTLLEVYREGDNLTTRDYQRKIIEGLKARTSTLNFKHELDVELFMLTVGLEVDLEELVRRHREAQSRRKELPTKIMQYLMGRMASGEPPPVPEETLRRVYRAYRNLARDSEDPTVKRLSEITGFSEPDVERALEYLSRRLPALGYRSLKTMVQATEKERIFWAGRRMVFDEGMGLYRLQDGSGKAILARVNEVTPATLGKYPDALVTGARFNKRGGFIFGRADRKPWFVRSSYAEAGDVIVQLRQGKVESVFQGGNLVWQNPESERPRPESVDADDWETLPDAGEGGSLGAEKIFWSGRSMSFDHESGLYRMTDGGERMASFRRLPYGVFERFPAALVTGVSLSKTGLFKAGRREGFWFSLQAQAGAQDLVLEVTAGRPERLLKPVYEGRRVTGYEEIYPGSKNVFWNGRKMVFDEASGLYRIMNGEEAAAISAFPQVFVQTLKDFPDALVTGVNLDSRGSLNFGREGGQPWFTLYQYPNAENLALEIAGGKPVRLYKPRPGEKGEISGYEEIYPGGENEFWSGKRMEFDEPSGRYRLVSGPDAVRLAAAKIVSPELLVKHPDALVTRVSLNKQGGFSFGRESRQPWFTLKAHGGASDLVLELSGGVPLRLFAPKYEKDELTGYEQIYPSERNAFWEGRAMVLNESSGLYELKDTGPVRHLGSFTHVTPRNLRDYPDAVVTGAVFNRSGKFFFGREEKRAWFKAEPLAGARGAVAELRNGTLYRVYHAGKIVWQNPELDEHATVIWTGREMAANAASGLSEIIDRPDVKRVGAVKNIGSAVLTKYPEMLMTGVTLTPDGLLFMGGKDWFRVPERKGARNLVLVWREGRPAQLFEPVYDADTLQGYREIYPGDRNAFWRGKVMKADPVSGVYRLAEEPGAAKLGAFQVIRAAVLRQHPDALVTGVRLDSKGALHFGGPGMRPWFTLPHLANAEDVVLQLRGGKVRQAFYRAQLIWQDGGGRPAMEADDWESLPGAAASSLGFATRRGFSVTLINEKFLTRPGIAAALIRHMNASPDEILWVVWHDEFLSRAGKSALEKRIRRQIRERPGRFRLLDLSGAIDHETAFVKALEGKYLEELLELARRIRPGIKSQTELMKFIGVLESEEILAGNLRQYAKVAEMEDGKLPGEGTAEREAAELKMILAAGAVASAGRDWARIQRELPDLFESRGGIFSFRASLLDHLDALMEEVRAAERLDQAA
jgi:hypothetical protein